MVSVPRHRSLVEASVVVTATSALYYFGNGLNPVWPLMWIAFVPVMWFALRASWWMAALTSVCALLLGNLNLYSYFTKTLGAPPSVWLAIFSVAALFFAAGVILFRALVKVGAVWTAIVALPSLWVTVEYLRNVATPHGSAGSLAYSQLGFLPFLQLASITGPWGMTFVLLVFASALTVALHLGRGNVRDALRIATVSMAFVALILMFGAIRLVMPRGPVARIGLIASDPVDREAIAEPGRDTERLFRGYADAAQELARKGVQAIVIPEKVGVTVQNKSAATDAVLQRLADETGATVVAGVVAAEDGAQYNQARVYTPGSTMQRYDKQHMLPPFESYLKPGTQLVTLQRGPKSADQTWGVAICKDMDFSNPARAYGKAGTGLLLVPAWDFKVDRSWHGHIAVMRGVEDGFSIARAAKNGLLTVSDDRGRILAEQMSNAAPFAMLITDVPATHHWTVYQAMGDWFVWVAMVLLLFSVGRMFVKK
jgi:apolipoprotein N-acyltransferase